MFESVKRVTNTTDGDWTISSRPAKELFKEGKEKFKEGDRTGWVQLLYSRMFFPGEKASLFEANHRLDNDLLGLPKEDLDEATKEAIRIGGG